MKVLYPIVTLSLAILSCAPSRAQQDSILISELRYKNQAAVSWDRNTKCEFVYYSSQQQRISLQVDLTEKETYYTGDKGTEVIFHLPGDLFHSSGSLKVYGQFFALMNGKNKVIRSREKEYVIDLTQAKKLNDHAFKATLPIEITEPETFSLTCLSNYINQKLSESSTLDGGFAATIDALNHFKDDFYDNRKIQFATLIDFFKLYEFLDKYAPDESFYNHEARTLGKIIEARRPGDTTKYITAGGGTSDDDPDTLEEVYREYLRTYAIIRENYVRLQMILFFRSR
jgi:hypothetical protein